MKKLVFTFIPLFAVLLSFASSVSASADTRGRLVLSMGQGEYILSSEDGATASSASAAELISSIDNGASLVLDNVHLGEPVTFSSDLTVGGVCTSSFDITVDYGARISFCDLSLSFTGGALLRNVGGAVTLYDSFISAQGGSAVILDGANASLTLIGGSIDSASSSPTLLIRKGSAALEGGSISNQSGAAVEVHGSLSLGKSPILVSASFDIITSEPIEAASASGPYGGGASIKYLDTFERGGLCPILLRAEPSLTDRISIYDAGNKPETLTYFDSYGVAYPQRFAGVYKPYTVKYSAEGVVISEALYLCGEIATLPEIPERLGYSPTGWFLSVTDVDEYNPALGVTDDLTLFALYKLSPPEFTLKSVETVYDGAPHKLSFDRLDHPLAAQGFFTYCWYDDGGGAVSRTAHLPYSTVADSGKYTCLVSFHHGQDIVSITTPPVSITVKPKEISPPVPGALEYTGMPLRPSIPSSALYTYAAAEYTDAGVYTVTLELTDPLNYRFTSGLSYAEVNFEILSATNKWINNISIKDTYFGAEPKPSALPLFGEVVFEYSASRDFGYSEDKPAAVGHYYVRARVSPTSNYGGLLSEPFGFSILNDFPISIALLTMPDRVDYSAFDYFDSCGLEFRVLYAGGKEEKVAGSDTSIRYQKDTCFRYGDTAVIVEYMGLVTSVPVTVRLAEYPFSLALPEVTVAYNGSFQSYPFSYPLPMGRDGIPLRAQVRGGGTDAGKYTIEVRFLTDSTDYRVPDTLYTGLTVAPMEVTVKWSNTVFTYDGGIKCPTASITDCYGAVLPLTVNGGAVKAGQGYTASAICRDSNYFLLGDSASFDIRKADYDMSGAEWRGSGAVYDGGAKSVFVFGLPKGVAVIGYTDNSAVDAGKYRASVALSYDSVNYNQPTLPDYEWEILMAVYDMSGVSVLGGSYVYDGTAKYPTVTGNMPVGADGSSPSFSFSRGVVNTFDSPYVIVSFSSLSKNYCSPTDVIVEVEVTPLGVMAYWSALTLVYNGSAQAPSATCSECTVKVSGAEVNSGKYVATAIADDVNYFILNESKEYTIEKASNVWLTPISAKDVYLGDEPAVEAEALCGTVEYRFYSDPALMNEAKLDRVGSFYVIAVVKESRNYLELTSAAVSFSVMEVLPVSLDIKLLNGDHIAFGTVTPEDLEVTVTFNNGSTLRVSDSSLVISYGVFDSLLAGDNVIYVTYATVTQTISVYAERAVLDLSDAVWQNTEFVYDGTVKEPELVGLPQGVTVSKLTGTGSRAGKHTVSAILSYDSANYKPPTVPSCTVTIKKQTVTPTVHGDKIYDGTEQMPDYPKGIYIPTLSQGYRDVGEYTVEFTLLDTDNYTFGTSSSAKFVIRPRDVDIALLDIDVFLFEDALGAGYTVEKGSIVEGDDIMLKYVYDGEVLRASAQNPNYRVAVRDARITYVPRPTPEVSRALLLCLLIASVLTLMLIIGVKRKDAILSLLLEVGDGRRLREDGRALISPPVEGSGDVSSGITVARANELISNSVAKTLIHKKEGVIESEGCRTAVVNVDTLCQSFDANEVIDINVLKERGLVPKDAFRLKILARGVIDKPLCIYANSFSISAVKMIALAGGEVNKVTSVKKRRSKDSEN